MDFLRFILTDEKFFQNYDGENSIIVYFEAKII